MRLGVDEVQPLPPDLPADGLLVAGEAERLHLALEDSNALIYDELRIQMDLILQELRDYNIFTMQHFLMICTHEVLKIGTIFTIFSYLVNLSGLKRRSLSGMLSRSSRALSTEIEIVVRFCNAL